MFRNVTAKIAAGHDVAVVIHREVSKHERTRIFPDKLAVGHPIHAHAAVDAMLSNTEVEATRIHFHSVDDEVGIKTRRGEPANAVTELHAFGEREKLFHRRLPRPRRAKSGK